LKKHLMIVMVLVICAAFVGAGCGGDDEETTTATTTETGASGAIGASGESGGGLLPDDFAAEADAICTKGDAEIDAEAQKFFGDLQQEPSAKDQEKFATDTVIPNIQEQIDGLNDLDAPEEGAAEWATFLEDAQSTLDRVKDDPSLLTEQAEGGENPFADVEALAKELGLAQCASDDSEEECEAEGEGGTADAG
jgi:hypothetical protein